MAHVSIVVPFHSNKNYLLTCLSALRRNLAEGEEIVVVQNNRDDGELVRLEYDDRIRSLYFSEDLGFSRACNIGVSEASGDYICICDADTISLTPRWLDFLLAEFRRSPDLGAAASLLIEPDTNRVQDFGIGWSGHNHFHPCYRASLDDPRLASARLCQMACSAQMMVRRDVFNRVGGFDEGLKYHYQDVDLCVRLKALGLKTAVVPQAKAFHRGHSAAVNKSAFQIDERGYYYEKNVHLLVSDIAPYVRESMELLAARVGAFAPLYLMVELSTIYCADELLGALFPDIKVRPLVRRHLAERDPHRVNLFETLGREYTNLPQPILFLVDSIESLRHNALWFSLRRNPNDIAVDRHGNACVIVDLETTA